MSKERRFSTVVGACIAPHRARDCSIHHEESLSHSSLGRVLRLFRISFRLSLLQRDIVDAEGRGERDICRVPELETDGLPLVGREAERLLRVNSGGGFVLVAVGRQGLQEGAAGVANLNIEEVVGRGRAFARATVKPEGQGPGRVRRDGHGLISLTGDIVIDPKVDVTRAAVRIGAVIGIERARS